MPSPTIAVVGAGFSGSLVSLHLRDRCPPGSRIYLIERSGQFGPGLAHAANQGDNLLNVSALRMTAFPDRPTDFVDWLRRQPAEVLQGVIPAERAFVPRRLYGAYLAELVRNGVAAGPPNTLTLLHDQADAIARAPDSMILRLRSGVLLHADVVVLATGNGPTLPPFQDVPVLDRAGVWRADPWDPATLAGLDPRAPVLIMGSGLTMVDVAVQMLQAGHTGPITALSRTGKLPTASLDFVPPPRELPLPLPAGLGPLLRLLRREAKQAQAAGQPWHVVVDALRPYLQRCWYGFSLTDKQRFIRHLRTWWDIHHHRMAPVVAERIHAACASGQLRIVGGRVEAAEAGDGRARVHYQRRGTGEKMVIEADRVINCTGPTPDITRHNSPLFQSLLQAGLSRPHPLRLGLDVADDCAVLDQNGMSSRRLFALGPLTRGTWWTVTAVPDIREQASAVASTIAAACARRQAPMVLATVAARRQARR
jgi:uncharacterized NAD(P)/FAD-binding protein YdhS